MNKTIFWLGAFVAACGMWLASAPVEALEWHGSGEVFGAHRKDRITTFIKAYAPPGRFIASDNLIAKNIHVVEGGMRGKAELCNGFFVKGFGSAGKIDYGHYGESTRAPRTDKVMSRARIHHGNVQDWSLATGYQYDVYDCVRTGFSVGWAYDAQSIRTSHATFKVSEEDLIIPDPELDGLRYKMRWMGPWIGVETRIDLPYITLDMGYEFHWAHWHAKWLLPHADVIDGSFSDRRHSKDSFGNVGFITVTYNFIECWTIAIGARYNYFSINGGREKPLAGSFATIGRSIQEVDKVHSATWQSFAMQLFLGYEF